VESEVANQRTDHTMAKRNLKGQKMI